VAAAGCGCETLVMFERFTDGARHVVVLGQDEARLFRHDRIGTEHLLLGLLREEGLAARALTALDVTLEEVRGQVAMIVGQGDAVATSGQLAYTPSAKGALERASNEALLLGHPYIGSEHILLGLLRVKEGVAARILLDFDADADKIRNELVRVLSGPEPGGSDEPSAAADRHPHEPAHLTVACPACAAPVETITTDRSNTRLHVSAEGERTCPGCGRRWRIAYTVSWEESSPVDESSA
jgi:ATP-dependent Clp protease ATP-binding subunit ClpA